jgi:hypothetical protein
VSDDDALSLMLSIGACVIRLKRGKPLTRRQTTVVLLANEDFRLKGFTEYVRLDEAMLLARFCKGGGFDLLLQQGALARCD